MDKTKVTIALSSYNQEEYIEECLEHLIAQDLQELSDVVSVELLVCDDCSTDHTREITFDYLSKHAGNSVLNEYIDFTTGKNLGMAANTKRMFNAFINGGSDYCCILEGDDYWISPFWLRDHLIPLMNDHTLTMSNNYICFYDQNLNLYKVREYPEEVNSSPVFTEEMVTRDNYGGNLTSSMYRTSCLRKIPDIFFLEEHIDDWYVNILLAYQGNIASIKQPQSVYRVHNKGVWNGSSQKKKKQEECSVFQRIRLIESYYSNRNIETLAEFATTWGAVPMKSRLYIDFGNGYSEENSLAIYPIFEDAFKYHVSVDIGSIRGRIHGLRYDPIEGEECSLVQLRIYIDGESAQILNTNASCSSRDEFIFKNKDPQIVINYSDGILGKRGKLLTIEGEIHL